jgi:ferrous iron transport protein A
MPSLSLVSLRPGEDALIAGIHAGEALHHRLAALGFRVGKRITLMRQGAFSGPLHLRIGGTDVIMRRRDARQIEIRACPP